jgi:predicted naringenin-chalcone synthase
MIGLGCAGAVPSLQQAADFTNAHLGLVSLMLAVEICSACYYFDDTMETVVGNAICSDGAAAVLLTSSPLGREPYPAIVDFESFSGSGSHADRGIRTPGGQAPHHPWN